MKKNRIFGLASGLALLLAGGCSNDIIDTGKDTDKNGVDSNDGFYMTLMFDLPGAKETRSYTDKPNSSDGGTEVGRDYENTVSHAYIVVATEDNEFIAAAHALNIDAVGTNGISYRCTAKLTKTEISELYDNHKPNQDGHYMANIFVFANPTQGLIDVLDHTDPGNSDWADKLGYYDETESPEVGKIWVKDEFLMANNSLCTRQVPPSLDEWDNYSTAATAFNLTGMNNYGRPNEIDNLSNRGNIDVERAAARYDFRDGALDGCEKVGDNYVSKNDPELNGIAPQTYSVVLDYDEKPLVNVFLGKMSMVNENKEFYFLRRVSLNGRLTPTLNDGSPNVVELLGPELPWYSNAEGTDLATNGNYVVDAFCDWKYSGNNSAPTFGFEGHFNYPFFNEEGIMDNAESNSDRWYSTYINEVLKGEKDASGKYATWRYLTEGTIPGITSQKNGVSNGIVFKGLLQPARAPYTADNPGPDGKVDDEFTVKLLEALQPSTAGNKLHDDILYLFGGHLHCTWEHIKREAIALSLTSLKWNTNTNKWDYTINKSTRLYNAVFGTGGFGTITFDCAHTGTLENANFLTTTGTESITDNTAVDPKAPNALYNTWKAMGGDDTVDPDETAEYPLFAAFRDAAVANNITLYQTSDDPNMGNWGYYCYYYYWNRHNDNGRNGIMGPMEFAVVRNNVYKLAVTKISRLGHPRLSANDPDAPTPNTPDEQADIYITVTCTTLPWVVRENNIVF